MAELNKLFGIDAETIEKLQSAGINSIEEFYEIAKHVDSRAELAEKTGVEPFKLEELSSTAGNFILMMDCVWE